MLSVTLGYGVVQKREAATDFECGKCDDVTNPGKPGETIKAGGKCLGVHAPDMRSDGGKVQVWGCNGEPQQQWRSVGTAIVNAGGKCLDVHAPDMRNDGGRVQVWGCNREPQQQWRLR